ncbi:hypothetical protein CK203_067891 [Vitis vinifera]|uniref:Uncharacterized protein n=1 Tax=Vitis vinifera TaxID=29760 RepID=A0A438BZ89_VITVI|nr:hypothetical protein CK203_067891 [Vitis vinifera]
MHHVTERLLELKKNALIYGGFNEDLQGGKKKGFLRLSLKASKGGTGFQCLKEQLKKALDLEVERKIKDISSGGKGWEILRKEIFSMAEIPSSVSLIRQIEAMITEKPAGCGLCNMKHCFASVVEEEGLRNGVNVLVGKRARAVICKSDMKYGIRFHKGMLASRARKGINEGRP